jgi:glycosyltransferase involved in cell wall biosynthesis
MLSGEIRLICEQNKITWLPLPYHKNPPILSTLYDIWILWNTVKRAHKENSFEIIHCRSYITSLIGMRAKQEWNVKFIFDMRGFWADERVEGGLWNLKNPMFRIVYNFFKRKEKLFLQASDYTVSLTRNAKSEIESWKIKNAPIMVIPTCVDIELFDPRKTIPSAQMALRKKLGISETDFVLLYLGSWGTWYLTENMFRYFSHVKKQFDHAKFLIVSSDQINTDRADIKQDLIVVSASRAEVPLYISIANMAVCFIKPSFSKKASSATKIGEILAMEVPVVSNEGWGDVKDFEEQGVFSLMTMNELNECKADVPFSNIRHRHSKLKELSLQYGIESYSNVYQRVLQK